MADGSMHGLNSTQKDQASAIAFRTVVIGGLIVLLFATVLGFLGARMVPDSALRQVEAAANDANIAAADARNAVVGLSDAVSVDSWPLAIECYHATREQTWIFWLTYTTDDNAYAIYRPPALAEQYEFQFNRVTGRIDRFEKADAQNTFTNCEIGSWLRDLVAEGSAYGLMRFPETAVGIGQ